MADFAIFALILFALAEKPIGKLIRELSTNHMPRVYFAPWHKGIK